MPTVGLGNGGGCCADPDGSCEKTCGAYKVSTEAMGVGYRAFHDALSYCNQAGLGAAVKDAVAAGKGNGVAAVVLVLVLVLVY